MQVLRVGNGYISLVLKGLINEYASKLRIPLCSLRYTALQIEKSMKNMKSTSCHNGNMDDSFMTVRVLTFSDSQ